MPRYLIALSIGPIQDFIAAARRTRDLWFGSHLLSEVSKAAAYSLREAEGVTLIFPAPQNPEDLRENSDLNVANKILAEAETDDPRGLLEAAKDAARHRWGNLASDCLYQLGKRTRDKYRVEFHVRTELWNDQMPDVLELFAAWVPLGTGQEALNEARHRLDGLLAARKNTRDFGPSALPQLAYGVPKSSLDGKRESVLPDDKSLPKWVKRKLGLNGGEQLDCPGVVKRLGGEDDAKRFTSIARIALDPWLRRIESEGGYLQPLHGPLESLIGDGLVTRVEGNKGVYQSLPFDGQLLYPFRLEAQENALKAEPLDKDGKQDIEGALERLESLRIAAQPYWKQYGQPCPYVAVLLADGDYMGKLLDSLGEAGPLREVSQALARFAGDVPGIVRDFHGHCIYSGGDDVLALVPLDQVLDCARALHAAFDVEMRLPFVVGDPKPSLSVGIGIGHLLEPMGKLLDLARSAEKLAKGDALPEAERRNALAIVLEPRSGAPIRMRGRWDKAPDKRLLAWIKAFRAEDIPDRAPYQLRELARELAWTEDAKLIEAEMRRILGRKRAGSGTRALDSGLLESLVNAVPQFAEQGGPAGRFNLAVLVEELLVARRLSQSGA